uniref:Lysophosphatidylcholine acyltransferase 2 n=2 Tax=Anthurium amnicola TaxID=1678845 RepID=A0A1D1ZL95_9ARAE
MEDGRLSLLTAPLLAQSPAPSGADADAAADVILDIGDRTGVGEGDLSNGCISDSVSEGVAGGEEEDGNPFEFLGAAPLRHRRPPCPVDPFRNHTPTVGGFYELCKMVLCLPVALARLLLFGISILVGFLVTTLALQGWKDRQSPMPRWRCRLMWVTRLCTRCILFSFGYHWIKRKGRPASRKIAPIVVSNHICYIEPIFFFYELFPTIVASESHDSIPFVGTIIRAMQVIYVDRFSASSRKNAVNEIKRKASCDEFPRVLLFPEGTTTNGRFLISFQLGAFIPGYPVQPVVVRYPYVHFDQSWGNISLAKLMFRMFTQFHNYMEVEYLPVIFPSENKWEGAIEFAERASHAMASALNVVQTSHSYGDVMLLTKALERAKGKPAPYMVEMAWVESSFNITTSEALEFLDKFLAMNPDSNGRVSYHDFLTAVKLGPTCLLSKKIFRFFDVENKGSINFQQFLLGSGYILKLPSFQQSCEATFNKCNDNGYVSMEKLGELVRSSASDVTDETLFELFKLFDLDKDGSVDGSDFTMFLQKNPLLIALFDAQQKWQNSVVVV